MGEKAEKEAKEKEEKAPKSENEKEEKEEKSKDAESGEDDDETKPKKEKKQSIHATISGQVDEKKKNDFAKELVAAIKEIVQGTGAKVTITEDEDGKTVVNVENLTDDAVSRQVSALVQNSNLIESVELEEVEIEDADGRAVIDLEVSGASSALLSTAALLCATLVLA